MGDEAVSTIVIFAGMLALAAPGAPPRRHVEPLASAEVLLPRGLFPIPLAHERSSVLDGSATRKISARRCRSRWPFASSSVGGADGHSAGLQDRFSAATAWKARSWYVRRNGQSISHRASQGAEGISGHQLLGDLLRDGGLDPASHVKGGELPRLCSGVAGEVGSLARKIGPFGVGLRMYRYMRYMIFIVAFTAATRTGHASRDHEKQGLTSIDHACSLVICLHAHRSRPWCHVPGGADRT